MLWELLEQWHQKQFVGRWVRKRRDVDLCMDGDFESERDCMVKPDIERTRCRLEGVI